MQSIRMSHIVRVLSEFVSYKILFVSRLVRFFAKKRQQQCSRSVFTQNLRPEKGMAST